MGGMEGQTNKQKKKKQSLCKRGSVKQKRCKEWNRLGVSLGQRVEVDRRFSSYCEESETRRALTCSIGIRLCDRTERTTALCEPRLGCLDAGDGQRSCRSRMQAGSTKHEVKAKRGWVGEGR